MNNEKFIIEYNDSDYKRAANFSQYLYSYPVTINKQDLKLIIGAGSRDQITIKDNYILTINYGLEYASLERIEENSIIEIIFLQNQSDFDLCPNFFDLSSSEQIDFLSNWEY